MKVKGGAAPRTSTITKKPSCKKDASNVEVRKMPEGQPATPPRSKNKRRYQNVSFPANGEKKKKKKKKKKNLSSDYFHAGVKAGKPKNYLSKFFFRQLCRALRHNSDFRHDFQPYIHLFLLNYRTHIRLTYILLTTACTYTLHIPNSHVRSAILTIRILIFLLSRRRNCNPYTPTYFIITYLLHTTYYTIIIIQTSQPPT
ncbi:unnamed protein product [Chrysodeixis includens]|uniref:Uncharacterized protein n=1 Tax=Chrysodeixis includens TaxID=689277 RepID=A0A9P0FS68_CHRIL|nr:unnamed protein product [Chrysodeixis includens]